MSGRREHPPLVEWRALKAEVREGYRRMDEQTGRWTAGYGQTAGRVYCRRGCSQCCALVVNATLTEALCVADALPEALRSDLPEYASKALTVAASAGDLREWLRGYRHKVGGCPLLAEAGACAVYRDRPFACRALLSTRPADWCAVDLSTLHPLEKQAFLSSLERSVVAWPTHYAAQPQEAGREAEAEASWRMRETFGFSLSGNLPFLLWLEQEFSLAALCRQGRGAVERLLAREIPAPFLVDLSP